MNDYQTRQTLLEKIKDQYDDDSWADFVQFYERFIYTIVRESGLSASESKDVTQQVLLKLWDVLPKFSYDKEKGGFRNWLYRVTKRTLVDYWRREGRYNQKKEEYGKDVDIHLPESSHLDELLDREWKAHIANLAMDKIRKRFSGKAIEVFYALLEGKSIAEVASEFDIAENSVYVYRARVSEKLTAEIKYLKKQLG